MASVSAESTQPEQRSGEAILAQVVAHAEDERLVDVRLERFGQPAADRLRPAVLDVDDRERLVERGHLLRHGAGGIDD